MKQSIQIAILIGFIIPFVLVSCKTPDTGMAAGLVEGVQQDLAGPVDEASLDAIAQAKAKAEESRSWAEYVNGSVYCSEEWTVAENRFKAANDRADAPATKAEAYAKAGEWTATGALYDDIFEKSASKFAGEQDKKLAVIREDAIKAGAEKLVPDRFAKADAVAASARQKYQAGDINGSIKEGKEAKDRYLILQTLAEARAKQEEADENDFFSVDPDNYMLAAEAGNSSVKRYDDGSLPEAQTMANDALKHFNEVLKTGWTPVIEEKADIAREWRAASQEVKADIAVRSDFAAAEQVYNRAYAAFRAGQYNEASDLFEQSEELFMIAHDNALEKRGIAEEALRQVERKLAESEEKAQNAEDLLAGGE